jgi:hypothetical protein
LENIFVEKCQHFDSCHTLEEFLQITVAKKKKTERQISAQAMQAVTYPLQLQASEPYQRVLSPDSGTEGEEQGRMVGGEVRLPALTHAEARDFELCCPSTHKHFARST